MTDLPDVPPRPWQTDDASDIFDVNGDVVAIVLGGYHEQDAATAAFIVEAANSHDTLRAERDALREENEKAAKLVKLCKGFVDKHRISCAEATAEDRVYENAPELVERIAKIVGFYEYPEDEE